MTTIEITKLDQVEKLIAELSPKEEKVLAKSNREFMKKLRRTAKLMAPRDTGELVNSIRIRQTKTKGKKQQYLLEVTAPHAGFQEDGFEPHFTFIRNSSKMVPGVYFVQKHTPFIKPAIERNFSRFSQNLNTGIREALKI